jgi:hypothetical protein
MALARKGVWMFSTAQWVAENIQNTPPDGGQVVKVTPKLKYTHFL